MIFFFFYYPLEQQLIKFYNLENCLIWEVIAKRALKRAPSFPGRKSEDRSREVSSLLLYSECPGLEGQTGNRLHWLSPSLLPLRQRLVHFFDHFITALSFLFTTKYRLAIPRLQYARDSDSIIHHRIHNSLPPVTILHQISQVHVPQLLEELF